MFWIGMLVGIIIVIAFACGAVIYFLNYYAGVSINEWADIVVNMEGVGHNRDAIIAITTALNEETEYERIICLKK